MVKWHVENETIVKEIDQDEDSSSMSTEPSSDAVITKRNPSARSDSNPSSRGGTMQSADGKCESSK